MPEQKAFLTKKEVALQYTRVVRNHINQQTNRKAAEQSRQRKFNQQRKKNALE